MTKIKLLVTVVNNTEMHPEDIIRNSRNAIKSALGTACKSIKIAPKTTRRKLCHQTIH